jgi:hypothetical protein
MWKRERYVPELLDALEASSTTSEVLEGPSKK